MSTLLLRLAAPLQSWGSSSSFEVRDTEKEPTKSGVIGLLAAALGIRRDNREAFASLSQLKFGVRIDREGTLLHDFHTVHEEAYWKSGDGKYAHITNRYYLCDAVFLVGLSSDDEERLKQYAYALTHPVYPPFLGRRSCPVTLPLVIGIRENSLEEALREEPSLTGMPLPNPVRIITDADNSTNGTVVRDVPVSFDIRRREYRFRKKNETCIYADKKTEQPYIHDAFGEAVSANVLDTDGT